MSISTCHTPAAGGAHRLSAFLVSLLALLATVQSTAQEFTWRTQEVGLGLTGRTNGVAVADYDRDGDLDIYFVARDSYSESDPSTWSPLFANRGDGTFMVVPSSSGLVARDTHPSFNPMGNKMGASWGDFDNDGWPDIYLTHTGPNQLFRNDRDGSFSDVTEEAGVSGGSTQVSSSAVWFDFDVDGDLDLYVSTWEDLTSGDRDVGNRMYENLGDDSFAEVAEELGLRDTGSTWTTVALDANNDGLLDLYLANDFGRNKVYLNNGDRTFEEATTAFGLEDIYHGMGLAVTDCDANGFFDIYLTNITESGYDEETNPLFLNSGNNLFVNSAADMGVSLAGWGWGTDFFDLENDGDEDLFVATGYFDRAYDNVLFRNTSESGTLAFENVAEFFGLADDRPARGLTVFDYDVDGDPDLLISNVNHAPSLYENPLPAGNWLEIRLEGTLSNRNGFGTIVEVEAAGELFKRYYHGAQFLGQNILPVHVGLGAATEAERVTVRWLSGHVDEIKNVALNQVIDVRETVGLVDGNQSTSVYDEPPVPSVLQLLGNYPNPFSHATQIRFALHVPGDVELTVFNALGRSVHATRRSYATAGVKTITWQPLDIDGIPPGSGLYFYRVRIDNEPVRIDTGTMHFVR